MNYCFVSILIAFVTFNSNFEKMNIPISIYNILVIIGLSAAFVHFEDDIEYEFFFKSKLQLWPEILGGGQSVNATLIARKFGNDGSSLVVRIKDSVATGKNIESDATSNIEGVFGIKRNDKGEITHLISKSTRAKGVLTKQNIVAMLANDFTFFYDYMDNKNGRPSQQRLPLSIGWCDTDITATTDPDSGLTKLLAQAEKSKCEFDNHVMKAGQYLLHGTTKTIGRTEDDSNFGMSVIFNSTTKRIMQVSKFTFLNLDVVGVHVQARHNMLLNYIGERPVSTETTFKKPYVGFNFSVQSKNLLNVLFYLQYPFTKSDIDEFIDQLNVE